MGQLAIFHAFAIRRGIDSDVYTLSRDANGANSEISLCSRHFLHIV